tara:strand:- start:179 stop:538 length:360 start_codon:yes stop_codon:yes gene_type:complete
LRRFTAGCKHRIVTRPIKTIFLTITKTAIVTLRRSIAGPLTTSILCLIAIGFQIVAGIARADAGAIAAVLFPGAVALIVRAICITCASLRSAARLAARKFPIAKQFRIQAGITRADTHP